jgi:hypothetical protein
MSLFQNILSEVSRRLQGIEGNTKEVAHIASGVVGVQIAPDQVRVKHTTVVFLVSPTVRAAIMLKKTTLLEQLKKYGILSVR